MLARRALVADRRCGRHRRCGDRRRVWVGARRPRPNRCSHGLPTRARCAGRTCRRRDSAVRRSAHYGRLPHRRCVRGSRNAGVFPPGAFRDGDRRRRFNPVAGAQSGARHPSPSSRRRRRLLIFVESYGAITYETPAITAGLAESRADLDAAIRETGRQVVSAYVESPTFGGSSWLAHLSLLSGVDVRDQYAYSALMASRRATMVTNFARRGYRTVALMPGMRQAWPEGAFTVST